ncbi:MAG: L-seryl-tRNA(Sec) selenium transferase [Thermodesulfobacteriota bacterium]|nr:L-seryl-tRNA(Sec) selenium transferase [Thermodesulfobacteriota bacterium]
MINSSKQQLLKLLPGVDLLLELVKNDKNFKDIPGALVKTSIRKVIDQIRTEILDNKAQEISNKKILSKALANAKKTMGPNLVPTINVTGVVLHTNLGRALLCKDALDNIRAIASGYSNLEFNIEKGKRGIRYSAVEDLLCELTGAEAAMAVNNNAGAVLLCLDTFADKKQVIVSRGELVEIGGSFRIPDVMAKSGGILKEVGTTNRTHLKDYEDAITQETALLLKVHTSNYKIQGFTASVPLCDLVSLGKKNGITVMEDLGSGTLIDFSKKWAKYGLGKEPTVAESVASGADIVTFSGDKLLGGPQAGIILGSRAAINKIKTNPLTRALRIDKLTLAALEATLQLYRDEEKAIKEIPCLNMLTQSFEDTAQKAEKILEDLKTKIGTKATVEYADLSSCVGGGAFPELSLPSRCIAVTPKAISAALLEKEMRMNRPAIIGRIEQNSFIIDPRTIQKGQAAIIAHALETILNRE